MLDPTTLVIRLRNLGHRSEEWLASLEVYTLADIERVGVVAIYRQLKAQGRPVTANMLYALQGARLDVIWTELPPEMRAELRAAAFARD